jgi:hypothetical protein
MNSLLIISIIFFALCLIMFFYLKWLIDKRTKSSALLAAGLGDRQVEVARLIAEIDRITDRDSQLVEDRILKLKAVIEEADKRIAVYLKELEKNRSSESLYTSLGRGIRDALENPEPEKAPILPQDTIELSDAAFSANQDEQAMLNPLRPSFSEVMELPLTEVPSDTGKPPAPPTRQQIRTHIDILLREGRSPEEIASQLEISIAEVNLAINLRRK